WAEHISGSREHPTRNPKRVVLAYDVRLADRVRERLVDGSAVTEQLMFGALAFLVAGEIAGAANSHGGPLGRVDPARGDPLRATTNARPIEMKRQVIRGWLHVDGDDLRTGRQLARWIAVGTAIARNVPTKRNR